MKKLLSLLLVLALGISFCACNQSNSTTAPTEATTPEQVAESFLKAMYAQDAQGVVAHIPDYALDAVAKMAGVEAAENKRQAITDSLAAEWVEEPQKATQVTVETKRAEDATLKETYLKAVQDHYIGEGLVTQEELDQVQDVVFVAFNADITFENGTAQSITDFKGKLPCVQVDGQWYVDFYYTMMAIPSTPSDSTIHIGGAND